VRVDDVVAAISDTCASPSNDRAGNKNGQDQKWSTYRMANFRGLNERMGRRVKQITIRATAARLNAPKMRRRSHRLTVMDYC
jgi:hypothetical protein